MGTRDQSLWSGEYTELTPSQVYRWLDERTCFFGIGSCFALNLQKWLRLHRIAGESWNGGMHYNPVTILYELERLAGRPAPEVIWEVEGLSGATFVDALRHPISARSLEELHGIRRAIIDAGSRALKDANAILITLGLAEVWQQWTEPYGWVTVNRRPVQGIIENLSFRNAFMSIEQIYAAIRDIVDLLQSVHDCRTRIIFSVSPIPLKQSNLSGDPRIANSRSKSLLHTALHEFVDDHPDEVTYFPAYEIFLGGSRPDWFWQSDCRHPSKEAIEVVCGEFVRAFAVRPEAFQATIDFDVPRAP